MSSSREDLLERQKGKIALEKPQEQELYMQMLLK
jgi:hypothetical protein